MEALALDEAWWLVSPGNPLKPKAGMAPLQARLLSARQQSRRAPIVPTTIEQQLGTRYTVDTIAALVRRYIVPPASIRKRGQWSAPALVLLRFDPDHRSATAIRRAHAGWAEDILGKDRANKNHGAPLRDRLTFREVRSEEDA